AALDQRPLLLDRAPRDQSLRQGPLLDRVLRLSVACDRGRPGGRPGARRVRAGRVRRGHADLFQPGLSATGECRRLTFPVEGNRMSNVSSRLAALALAAGLALAGGAASAQTKVVVRTDFKFNGYISPLALAVDKGFYREAGLDVAIEQGQGSAT